MYYLMWITSSAYTSAVAAHHGSAIEHGQIVENGTFEGLMTAQGQFHKLVSEFASGAVTRSGHDGNAEEAHLEVSSKKQAPRIEATIVGRLKRQHVGKAAGTGKLEVRPATGISASFEYVAD